jgi:hypothetical protein
MSCTLNGLSNSCGRTNVPGVKNLWIGVYDTGTTINNAAGVVTSITGATYYRYQPAPTSSMWSDDGAGTLEFLSYAYTHHVEAYFPGFTAAIRNELYLLGQAKLSVAVQTMTDEVILLGKDNGLWMMSDDFNSGKKSGEGYGTAIVLEGAAESGKGLMATSIFSAYTNSTSVSF